MTGQVQFLSSQLTELTTCKIPGDLDAPLFRSLKIFVLNQIQPDNLNRIPTIAQSLRSLTDFYLNVCELKSTTFQPNPDQLELLRSLYKSLVSLPQRQGLRIYIHNVQLVFAKQFNDYHFEKPLLELGDLLTGLTMQPCHSVSTVVYHRLDGPISFHQSFPCIQTVHLEMSNAISHHSLAFLDFLVKCDGLTELKIDYGYFPNFFYEKLAKIASCRTLRSLTIFEAYPPVTDRLKRVDFATILRQFPSLCRFETNLVPRDDMQKLMLKMISRVTTFRFKLMRGVEMWPKSFFRIRKISETSYLLHGECWLKDFPEAKPDEPYPDHLDPNDPEYLSYVADLDEECRKEFLCEFTSIGRLLKYLKRIKRKFTVHFLDDLS